MKSRPHEYKPRAVPLHWQVPCWTNIFDFCCVEHTTYRGSFAWLQASAAKLMQTALFWVGPIFKGHIWTTLYIYLRLKETTLNAWNIASSEIIQWGHNARRVFRVRLLHCFFHFLWMPHLLMGKSHTDAEGLKTNSLASTCVATLAHSIYPANIIFKRAFEL